MSKYLVVCLSLTLMACHEGDPNGTDLKVAGPDVPTQEVGPDATDTNTPDADTTGELPPGDVPVDVPAELPLDVPAELPTDVPGDVPAELPLDVPTELPLDVPGDVPGDVPDDEPTDVPGDVPTELPLDVTTETETTITGPTIADLRTAPEDTVLDPAIVVEGATVTYVKPLDGAGGNGYFIQQEATGPGIFVFTDAVDPSTLVTAGDIIDISVTEVAEYQGNKQVKTAEATVQSSGNSVDALTQDLTNGMPLTEATEAERLRLTGGTLVHGIGDVWTVEYAAGQQSATIVYFGGFEDFGACKNMVVSVVGIGTEFIGSHQLQIWRGEDIVDSNGDSCAPATTANWGFENGPDYEPPSGFNVALNSDIGMVDETTDFNTGDHSVGVIWYTSDNWEMRAAWLPSITGATADYRLHAWYLDEDPCAKSRVGVKRWDAAKAQVGGTAYSSYTADSARWQEVVASVTPEAGDSYMSLFARFYDEVSEDACYADPANKETTFDGGILYFDDWALTQTATFEATDGVADTLMGEPAAAPLLFGGVSGAINDIGQLYLTAPQSAGNEHIVYVWVGEPSLSATVPAAREKDGVVAAAENGVLLALAQDQGLNCVWEIYDAATGWTPVDLGLSACSDATGSMLEGRIDLTGITALNASDANALPGNIALVLAPYGVGAGGVLDSGSQQPAPITNDNAITGDEAAAVHRNNLLVGRVTAN